jgi:hypothetical protein
MRCRKFTMAEARKLRKQVRVPSCVSDKWWLVGLNVELEHADVTKCSPLLTARIAAVHDRESCTYYRDLLAHVEKR